MNEAVTFPRARMSSTGQPAAVDPVLGPVLGEAAEAPKLSPRARLLALLFAAAASWGLVLLVGYGVYSLVA